VAPIGRRKSGDFIICHTFLCTSIIYHFIASSQLRSSFFSQREALIFLVLLLSLDSTGSQSFDQSQVAASAQQILCKHLVAWAREVRTEELGFDLSSFPWNVSTHAMGKVGLNKDLSSMINCQIPYSASEIAKEYLRA
jgi:hypothetical protein